MRAEAGPELARVERHLLDRRLAEGRRGVDVHARHRVRETPPEHLGLRAGDGHRLVRVVLLARVAHVEPVTGGGPVAHGEAGEGGQGVLQLPHPGEARGARTVPVRGGRGAPAGQRRDRQGGHRRRPRRSPGRRAAARPAGWGGSVVAAVHVSVRA
ncbi:hypothetical protein ATKI12_4679 [Kitasatospora sp. Ki12]